MADSTIYDLPALGATPASGDRFALVDVSDTTDSADGSSKHCTFAELAAGMGGSPVNVLETADFQLDPAGAHPDRCVIVVAGSDSSGAFRNIKLPATIDQPDIGYTVLIASYPSANVALDLLRADDSPAGTNATYYMRLTYVNTDTWQVESYATPVWVYNTDPV